MLQEWDYVLHTANYESHMRNLRPMMFMVLPIPKSFGENHSSTSLSLTSITELGKWAAGRYGEKTTISFFDRPQHIHVLWHATMVSHGI